MGSLAPALMIYFIQDSGGLDPWEAIGRVLGTMAAIWYVVWLLLAVLGILSMIFWLFVPFALFGIKKRLSRIAEALEAIRDRIPTGDRPGENILIKDDGPDIFRTGR